MGMARLTRKLQNKNKYWEQVWIYHICSFCMDERIGEMVKEYKGYKVLVYWNGVDKCYDYRISKEGSPEVRYNDVPYTHGECAFKAAKAEIDELAA